VAHVLSNHLDKFFTMAEVEVDPPKGNFQVINKCGVTGELLGPPNYHRYNQIVMQHYTAKVGSRMALDAFRGRIETIRDPEVVNQWPAKMKKATPAEITSMQQLVSKTMEDTHMFGVPPGLTNPPANPNQPMATSWRPAGAAVDFLSNGGFNVLSIVVELPKSMLR